MVRSLSHERVRDIELKWRTNKVWDPHTDSHTTVAPPFVPQAADEARRQ
jgi:hypothetical protein